jgi:hypothetical protein
MCLLEKDDFFGNNSFLKVSQVVEFTSVVPIQNVGIVPDSGSGKIKKPCNDGRAIPGRVSSRQGSAGGLFGLVLSSRGPIAVLGLGSRGC